MIMLINKKRIVNITLLLLLFGLLLYYAQNGAVVSMSGKIDLSKKVVIDPGHGGEDPGAVSDFSGLREKDVNLTIAKSVSEKLKAKGLQTVLTREDDVLEYGDGANSMLQKRREDLKRRKEIMDSNDTALVVSIHLNKFPQDKYFGAQTFYPPNSRDSQKLAQIIQRKIREKVDPNNKREALLKKEPIIILRDIKNITVIVECGFLSNEQEEKKLGEKAYQEKLASAIAEGIGEFLKG